MPATKLTQKNKAPIEKGYLLKKLSLTEYQIVELTIKGDEVLERVEREPDLAAIVIRKLMAEIAKSPTENDLVVA